MSDPTTHSHLIFSSDLVWLDTLPFHFWPECPKWNGREWQCLRIWVYQVLVETPKPLERVEHKYQVLVETPKPLENEEHTVKA